uniref:Secreted protein n=1 Tax=Caenorhabditis tropicalis TaxID=1561998 RepID=A0A1I7TFF3_9PELO
MLSLRSCIILFGLLAVALACAPHMPKREVQHGWCKFYVDGKNDFDSARRKRDSSGSDGSGSGEGGGGKRYNRSKKRKDKKCYEYEDGTKDEGAVLEPGVKYTVTITKS